MVKNHSMKPVPIRKKSESESQVTTYMYNDRIQFAVTTGLNKDAEFQVRSIKILREHFKDRWIYEKDSHPHWLCLFQHWKTSYDIAYKHPWHRLSLYFSLYLICESVWIYYRWTIIFSIVKNEIWKSFCDLVNFFSETCNNG